jgi:hypothetical protein
MRNPIRYMHACAAAGPVQTCTTGLKAVSGGTQVSLKIQVDPKIALCSLTGTVTGDTYLQEGSGACGGEGCP